MKNKLKIVAAVVNFLSSDHRRTTLIHKPQLIAPTETWQLASNCKRWPLEGIKMDSREILQIDGAVAGMVIRTAKSTLVAKGNAHGLMQLVKNAQHQAVNVERASNRTISYLRTESKKTFRRSRLSFPQKLLLN